MFCLVFVSLLIPPVESRAEEYDSLLDWLSDVVEQYTAVRVAKVTYDSYVSAGILPSNAWDLAKQAVGNGISGIKNSVGNTWNTLTGMAKSNIKDFYDSLKDMSFNIDVNAFNDLNLQLFCNNAVNSYQPPVTYPNPISPQQYRTLFSSLCPEVTVLDVGDSLAQMGNVQPVTICISEFYQPSSIDYNGYYTVRYYNFIYNRVTFTNSSEGLSSNSYGVGYFFPRFAVELDGIDYFYMSAFNFLPRSLIFCVGYNNFTIDYFKYKGFSSIIDSRIPGHLNIVNLGTYTVIRGINSLDSTVQEIVNNFFINNPTTNVTNYYQYFDYFNNSQNYYNDVDWFSLLQQIIQGNSVPTVDITINDNNYYPDPTPPPGTQPTPTPNPSQPTPTPNPYDPSQPTYPPADLTLLEDMVGNINETLVELLLNQVAVKINISSLQTEFNSLFSNLYDEVDLLDHEIYLTRVDLLHQLTLLQNDIGVLGSGVSQVGVKIDDMNLELASKLDILHSDLESANQKAEENDLKVDLTIQIIFLILGLLFLFLIIYLLQIFYSFIWSFLAPFLSG